MPIVVCMLTETHTHTQLQTAVSVCCRYSYIDTATDTFVSASAPDNCVSTKANVRVVHLFHLLTTVVVPRPLCSPPPPLLDQLFASGCRCAEAGWARGGVAAAILISRTAMYRQVLFSRSCLLLLCIWHSVRHAHTLTHTPTHTLAAALPLPLGIWPKRKQAKACTQFCGYSICHAPRWLLANLYE